MGLIQFNKIVHAVTKENSPLRTVHLVNSCMNGHGVDTCAELFCNHQPTEIPINVRITIENSREHLHCM